MASRFGVPVYLYEEAATNPARKNLEDIRRGEFEGLAAKMATPGWAPDFGPAAPHPSAGASVIGARMPLIAYNINLATDRLDVAKKIAAAVRHSSGGLRFVKAMGVMLEDRGIVQVSMNLTNYEKTPIPRVFEFVKREAARYGVNVLESEVVGLVPQAALIATAEYYLQLEGFSGLAGAGNEAERGLMIAGCRLRVRSVTPPPNQLFLRALARRDAERPHLPIEVASLDAEGVRRPRHVAALAASARRMYSRSKRSRASCSGSSGAGLRRRSASGRPAIEKRQVRRGDRSPGTMITSRSIRFRSSRTLPGHE